MKTKNILGLDLGVASIGWAYIEKSSQTKGRIKGMGVRIIPTSKDESSVFNDFAKGSSASFSKERTVKRGGRRNNFRRKLRRDQLVRILKENNMFDDQLVHLTNPLAIWELRSKAVNEKVSATELGRVLLHLNQKRGFKSNRKASGTEEGDSAWLNQVASNSQQLREMNMTVGQFIEYKLNTDPTFSSKGHIFKRNDYVEEFNRIWATQAKYHSFLTDDLKAKIGDRTIFYQRPLKSAKYLLSNCRFEKGHKVNPRSSPLFQYFRTFEKVLNLRAYNAGGDEEQLSNNKLLLLLDAATRPEKELLDKKGNLSASRIRKLLQLGSNYDFNYDYIEGSRTILAIYRILKEGGENPESWISFDPLGNLEKQPVFKLWHVLYSIDDPDVLKNILTTKFNFSENVAIELMGAKLESDYGALSARAIKKILPHFKNYPENATHGVLAAGYKLEGSETKDEKSERKLVDALPHLKKGELRNPVVEKVLNQVITLVNEIILDPDLGRPDEVRVELARELKSGAKERKRIEDAINRGRRTNEKIRKILHEEFGIKKPGRRDIIRYKLWLEQNHQCLYSGEMIPRAKLFADGEYELDHIIPRARMFNDSIGNLALVKISMNKAKADQTAFDFMASKGKEALDRYNLRIQNLYHAGKSKKVGDLGVGISKSKRDFLKMKKDEIPPDFIERQLRESQYIAKETIKRLNSVCRNVHSTTGQITDLLRYQWGIENVFKEIQLPKYREWGRTYIEKDHKETLGEEKIMDWSKRNDHRHHAMDALIVACTEPKHINTLNNLNTIYEGGYNEMKSSLRKFDVPWVGFRKDAKAALENILVSYRNRRRVATRSKNHIKIRGGEKIVQITLGPRDKLHEETVYGLRKVNNASKVKLNKRFKREQFDLMVNKKMQGIIEAYVEEYGGDWELAMQSFKKGCIIWNDQPLVEVPVYDLIYTYRVPLNDKFNKPDQIIDKAVKEKVLQRLAECDNKPKKAFEDLENNPIWFDKPWGKQIKRVTIRQKATELTPVRMMQDGTPKDYVFTGNNHHISVFKNEKGKYYDEVTSFWQAFERKSQGLSVYEENSSNGDKALLQLKINDMVLIDFDGNPLTTPPHILSNYLFRVQKLTKGDVFFRHHVESTLDNKQAEVRITSPKQMVERVQKVRLSKLGKITG